MPRTWIEDEPGFREAKEILAVAWATARARWLITLVIATAVTTLVVAWYARHPRTYASSLVVRVVETGFDQETAAPTNRELTGYINAVFLTRTALHEVIREHDLYPDMMGPDPSMAIEAMREDLDVHVVQNYFASERFIRHGTRSARIVITFEARHPDLALAVVRDLGDRIARAQTELRVHAADMTVAAADMAYHAAATELAEARRLQSELSFVRDEPLNLIRLSHLDAEIKALDLEVATLASRRTKLDLRSRLEGESIGMRFEVVDNGQRAEVLLTRKEHLTLMAVLSFLFFLPISALGVGTLGSRIHDPRALKRLGLDVIGTIRTRTTSLRNATRPHSLTENPPQPSSRRAAARQSDCLPQRLS